VVADGFGGMGGGEFWGGGVLLGGLASEGAWGVFCGGVDGEGAIRSRMGQYLGVPASDEVFGDDVDSSAGEEMRC
jgi:hypothetical protein